MQQETRTRGSQEENIWSEENQIYYYSNFQFFEGQSDSQEFYLYSIFVEELQKQLGQQWKQEAEVLCQQYFSSTDIFMNLLALWLKCHGPKLKSGKPVPTFESSFTQEFVQQIKQQLGNKEIKDKNINIVSAKALTMGFFLTANDIWSDLFQKNTKPQPIGNIFLKSVSETIQKTFKPIMVVRQKIGSLFGKKKLKKNNNQSINTQNAQIIFENCYHNFKKNWDIQKQLQRKIKQFSLQEQQLKNKQQNIKKIVSTNTFKQQQGPIKNNILSSVYQYVTGFLNRNHSWQVASSFVTQILDMNQLKTQEGTKIKVLRPAQDFYQKLILVWLSFKNQQYKVNFKDYLSRVKSTFGNYWHEKYVIPTKYFFQRLLQNWEKIQLEIGFKKLTEKQILESLLRRIRVRMADDWDRKIKISKRHKSSQQIHQ